MLSNIKVDLSRFDWQGVSGASDVLMVVLNIVLIVSVVVGYRSLRESVLTRDASLLTWAMERMTAIRDDLEMLWRAPSYGTMEQIRGVDFTSPWPAELEKAAQRVSVELQRLSYLANSGLISKTHFMSMWGPTFARAWISLEPWVKHRRFTNGEPIDLKDGAYSRNDFERFACECAGMQAEGRRRRHNP